MRYYIHEMSWTDVREVLRKTDTVIVPLGALEGHGPHNPVGSCFILAHETAKAVGHRTGIPVTPTIPFGVSTSYQNFAGTITVSLQTLKKLVEEVCESLIRHGFRRFIFFSAHGGGNLAVLSEIAEEMRERTGALFAVLHIWGLVSQVSPEDSSPPGTRGGHGGDPTTSVMLYLTPDLVNMNRAEWIPLEQPLKGMTTQSYAIHEFRKIKITIPLYPEEVSEQGVMADPTKASKERGEKLYKALIDYLVQFVENFRKIEAPNPPRREAK